jgi:hypothetical protein
VRGVLAIIFVLGLPLAAHAQEALPAAAGEDDEARGKGDGKGTPDKLQFGGRVFVRDTLQGLEIGSGTRWTHDRDIESGRAFLDFRPNKKLRMVLEVEFGDGEPELKDTFIRYRPVKPFEIKAGRFKRPVSFINLESAWSLPRIDRGVLSDIRIDRRRLPFAGGRSDGFALALDLGGALRPELTIAVLQSDVDHLSIDASASTSQELYGRAEIEPVDGLHLAAAGGWIGAVHRRSQPDSYHHRPFGTVEAMFEHDALRVWLEAMAGLNTATYVGPGAGTVQIGRTFAARGLVAPRLHRLGPLRTLEPFAAFSWWEPSTKEADDQVSEITGGLAVGISRHLRLQLEAGRIFVDGIEPLTGGTVVRLQLGAAFKSETTLH